MAAVAAAQLASIVPSSDEADAHVERVIKAAQDIRLDEQRPLDLTPKAPSSDSSIYFGGQLASLSGGGRPEGMLASQVTTLGASPQLQSDVRVEAYRIGYRLPLARTGETDAMLPVSLHSILGVTVVDASFSREDAQGMMVEQGLLKGAPLLGFELEWPISWRFSVASEMTATVPLESMPWIFSAQLLGRYHLGGKRDGGVRAFAGLGYERISVQDEAVNRIQSDSGPMLLIGIEARY